MIDVGCFLSRTTTRGELTDEVVADTCGFFGDVTEDLSVLNVVGGYVLEGELMDKGANGLVTVSLLDADDRRTVLEVFEVYCGRIYDKFVTDDFTDVAKPTVIKPSDGFLDVLESVSKSCANVFVFGFVVLSDVVGKPRVA